MVMRASVSIGSARPPTAGRLRKGRCVMAATTGNTVGRMGSGTPERPATDADQRRRDRLTLLVVLALFAGLVALIIWLASLGGTGPTDYEPLLF